MAVECANCNGNGAVPQRPVLDKVPHDYVLKHGNKAEYYMKMGLLVYRCRMCNATFHPTSVPDLRASIINVITEAIPGDNEAVSSRWREHSVSILEMHECGPGMVGLGDLIGGALKPKNT